MVEDIANNSKLSDNPNKAMGPADEIARYKRVFGVGEQTAQQVIV